MQGSLVIFAIDLELSGCYLDKDNIVAIGWSAIQLTTGEVVNQGLISLKPLEGRRAFEPRCLDEFWSKYPALLKDLQAVAVPAVQGMAEFFMILDDFDRNYDVRIVTDNPCGDIAWLDLYASMLLDRRPLCYKFGSNDWRPVYDTDSFARGVAKLPYRDKWTDNKEVARVLGIDMRQVPAADHNPMNDARAIATMHRLVYLKQYE